MKRNIIIDIIIVVVIVIFLNIFSLVLIPEKSFIPKALFLLGLGMAAFTVHYLFIAYREELFFIDKVVLSFVLSFFLGAFMAKAYWHQTLLNSIKSQLYFYIFFLYFTLLSIEISERRILGIIKVLFFSSLVVFLIDYITLPNPLFTYRHELRRGGVTVFFTGQGFTFLGGFYFLEQYFKKRKLTHLFLFVLSAIFLFFLTQARMMLLAIVLGALFLLFRSNFKRKYLIISFVAIGLVGFYLNSQLFRGVRQLNRSQAEHYESNIRLKSQHYFLFDLQGGEGTRVFGNGIPGETGDLRKETMLARFQGYYQSDVGITGIYNYFGILGVVAWILFFYVVFKAEGDDYIKAYFLALSTTLFTGYSLFDPGYMGATVLTLYLIRHNASRQMNSFSVEKTNI